MASLFELFWDLFFGSIESKLVMYRAASALAILALERVESSKGLTRSDIQVEPNGSSKYSIQS